MRVALAIVVAALAVLIFTEAAGAHAYLTPKPFYQERAEVRLNGFRLENGQPYVFNSISTHLMGVAMSHADYEERKLIGFQIAGVPFATWSLQFVPPAFGAALLKTYRCYGKVFTPMQAVTRMSKVPRLRRIMLDPEWQWASARVVYAHAHEGYFEGRGRCTVYYFGFAG